MLYKVLRTLHLAYDVSTIILILQMNANIISHQRNANEVQLHTH